MSCKKVIRLAVGEVGNQLSPTYRIWNNRNDVYLGDRTTAHFFKVSLHESGVWTVAATSDSGLELQPGNRRLKRWYRPQPEPGQTWVSGTNIAVPRIPEVDHIKITDSHTGKGKDVDWIPAPEIGTKAVISLILPAPGQSLADAMGIETDCNYLELDNAQRVYPICQYSLLDRVDHGNIAGILADSQAPEWISANNNDVFGFLSSWMRGGLVPCIYVVKWGATPNPLFVRR
ncbi:MULTISPECIES: hypothetical protein [Mycobacteroides]|jgi:hypothetical protein|uniref:Uncharacterized protein n=1 Tax=Mycobacteroides chelonae TaxID=1774 RepID=A0A1S1LIJ0_MYCCH|nr:MULTISPECIES: hypothetical protein [Mycobacteroides]KRQ21129.1 hypothetical protein AOT91_26170 [Mycobacteroides sp. H092]KRQ21249.1 hypothetical protein AOT87_16625 [Mycobacteroides sp. H003]KRQ44297.1 hypothetical protein AOT88_21910 [Mycobacteroides sp. H063]KRQ45528.1 hypothetical protein AOT92_03050 [Mycobacteroides sp. H101]KRQ61572.1 hypothetical protein AOT94_04345 [Mycobacteroides sp. HXVII]